MQSDALDQGQQHFLVEEDAVERDLPLVLLEPEPDEAWPHWQWEHQWRERRLEQLGSQSGSTRFCRERLESEKAPLRGEHWTEHEMQTAAEIELQVWYRLALQ